MNYVSNRDIHVLKYFSSFISVSEGKVIYISEPKINFCPLAAHFYKELRGAAADKKKLKQAIREIIESKISEYGFFTPERDFTACEIQVPYGASEMLMFALRSKVIDAAVVVCDGAGTVICDTPEIIQGIGARMHNLVMTSPICRSIQRLAALGCRVVNKNALIDQYLGVRRAAESGYKTIAVTISGYCADSLEKLKDIERDYGVRVISLVICTSLIRQEAVEQVLRYADLVWSCSSEELRRKAAHSAKIQLSELMPVFVMSEAGIDFAAGYCHDPDGFISGIDKRRKYLISSRMPGRRILMGNFAAYIIEEPQLPALSPEFSAKADSKGSLSAVIK